MRNPRVLATFHDRAADGRGLPLHLPRSALYARPGPGDLDRRAGVARAAGRGGGHPLPGPRSAATRAGAGSVLGRAEVRQRRRAVIRDVSRKGGGPMTGILLPPGILRQGTNTSPAPPARGACAGGQLQRVGRDRPRQDQRPASLARLVVEPRAALGDQPLGVLARVRQPGAHEKLRQARCRRPASAAASVSVGRSSPMPPCSKTARAVASAAAAASRAVQQRGHLVGQHDLGGVDLGALPARRAGRIRRPAARCRA